MAPTVAQQIAAVRAEMAARPAGLVHHVERVLVEALDLAGCFDLDSERVELAVWGHDLFRAHTPEEQLQLARECGIAFDAVEEQAPVLLHGPVAAVVLRERFDISDEEALQAVRDHTSGLPEMSMLAKVILIADKVEKSKRTRAPLMAEVRHLARRDLDLALLCWADWKWVEEVTRGYEHQPAHWRARAVWVGAHHAEMSMPRRVSAAVFEKAATGV